MDQPSIMEGNKIFFVAQMALIQGIGRDVPRSHIVGIYGSYPREQYKYHGYWYTVGGTPNCPLII